MNEYSIYQLRMEGDANRLYGVRYEEVEKLGAKITPDNYERVYQSPPNSTTGMNINLLLSQIYDRFNSPEPPEHYTGYGINTSDIVVMEQDDVVTAYYWDVEHWVSVPEFAEQLQERLEVYTKDSKLLVEMESDDILFRAGTDSYLSIREMEDGYDYRFLRPHDHSSVEGNITFSDLTDLSEEFPDYALFYLLSKAICKDMNMEREDMKLQPMNPDRERNFRIEPTQDGYQVYSDSKRFGNNAVVFESPDRESCMDYIAARRIEGTPLQYYIIPDIMTWAVNESLSERSPLELYDNLDAAIHRFKELRDEPFNNEPTLNEQSGRPYARLTLGVQRSYPIVDVDLIHVMAGRNKLVTDFLFSENNTTSREFLSALERLEKEVGFDVMYLTYRNEEGHFVEDPTAYQPLPVNELLGVVDRDTLVSIPAEEINMGTEQEVLYDLDDTTYLHLQITDEGFDYTFYDKATQQEQDGGIFGLEDLPEDAAPNLESAKAAILNYHDLQPEEIRKQPLKKLDELLDGGSLGSFSDLLQRGIADAEQHNKGKAAQPQKGKTL